MAGTINEVLKYLSLPAEKRPAVGFDATRLESSSAFDVDQANRLGDIARLRAPLDKRAVEKLLIDLSWASSHLEGNTYTQLDTISLIQFGQKNNDKAAEEAVMILNHKAAISHLLACRPNAMTVAEMSKIHALLSDSKHAPDSRHSTAHSPLLQKHLETILSKAASDHPINAAFYLMTRLPYLLPFMDGNKRTSRLVANAPLMNACLAPCSFEGMDRSRYVSGIMAFYELGHESLLQEAFLEAYAWTCLQYRLSSSEDRLSLVNDREIIKREVCDFVMTGARPSSELLLKLLVNPEPLSDCHPSI